MPRPNVLEAIELSAIYFVNEVYDDGTEAVKVCLGRDPDLRVLNELIVRPDGKTCYIDPETGLLKVRGGGGTGGGVTDYADLDNLPSIEGTTLKGAMKLEDIGITTISDDDIERICV